MKGFYLATLMLFSSAVFAQNHGVNLSWTASTSQAGCVSPCTFMYLVYEGPSAGQEGTNPIVSTLTTSAQDSGNTLNAFSGTTRCYYVKYRQVSGGVVTDSPNSNEDCAIIPPVNTGLAPPTALTHTVH